MKKIFGINFVIMQFYLLFFVAGCSDVVNPNKKDDGVSKYSNEYLEIIVEKSTSRSIYYNSADINQFKLIVDFKDPSITNLGVTLSPTDKYKFNIFQDCNVILEVSGYNSSSKKIAFGSKAFDFKVGNDVTVIVPVDMLEKSSEVTVNIIINENSSDNDFIINNKKYKKTGLVPVITEEDGSKNISGTFSSGPFISNRTIMLSPFEIGQYEVTQDFFEGIMGTNPSQCTNEISGEITELKPVDSANWYQVIAFCNKLSILCGYDTVYTVSGIKDWGNLFYNDIPSGYNSSWQSASVDLTKNGYRLPTEAEWEFAARGGDVSANDWNYIYAGSNNYSDVAWASENSQGISHEVGLKLPNQLDLYDMSGNLYEWCSDFYSNIGVSEGIIKNPIVTTGEYRIQRSGAWKDSSEKTKISMRRTDACGGGDSSHWEDWGFRLCRNLGTRADDDITYIKGNQTNDENENSSRNELTFSVDNSSTYNLRAIEKPYILYSETVPIAMITFEDENYNYGISLNASNSESIWSMENKGYYSDIACASPDVSDGFKGDREGYDNWDVIKSVDSVYTKDEYLKDYYPPYYFVNKYAENNNLPEEYSSDWYLPSIYEIFQVSYNADTIKQAFTEAGIETNLFSVRGFWSSSQAMRGVKSDMCDFPDSLLSSSSSHFGDYCSGRTGERNYCFAMRRFNK